MHRLGDATTDWHGLVQRAMDEKGSWNLTARWLRAFYDVKTVLKVGLIDHSGLSVYCGGGAHEIDPGGWDSGTVGLIFDTPHSREECGTPDDRIEEVLKAEIVEYDLYITGDVWGAKVEKMQPADLKKSNLDAARTAMGPNATYDHRHQHR